MVTPRLAVRVEVVVEVVVNTSAVPLSPLLREPSIPSRWGRAVLEPPPLPQAERQPPSVPSFLPRAGLAVRPMPGTAGPVVRVVQADLPQDLLDWLLTRAVRAVLAVQARLTVVRVVVVRVDPPVTEAPEVTVEPLTLPVRQEQVEVPPLALAHLESPAMQPPITVPTTVVVVVVVTVQPRPVVTVRVVTLVSPTPLVTPSMSRPMLRQRTPPLVAQPRSLLPRPLLLGTPLL